MPAASRALSQLAGPVESPAGWHLVKVLEIRDAVHTDISEPETRRKTRRMLVHERLDDYVVNLRKNVYPVEVYNDVFNRIVEEEVEKLKARREKVQQSAG